MSLTNKQRAFIEYYLQTWNAGEAARLAGYSPKTAYVIGYENLRKPQIKAEINRRLAEIAMSSNEVLARLSQQASSTFEDFISFDYGVPRVDLEKAAKSGKLHLIKKLSYNKEGFLQSIELHDAQSALVQLGRYHKLFADRVEVDWRVELQQAGIDASAVFDEMVREFAERIPAGEGRDDEGRMGRSEETEG